MSNIKTDLAIKPEIILDLFDSIRESYPEAGIGSLIRFGAMHLSFAIQMVHQTGDTVAIYKDSCDSDWLVFEVDSRIVKVAFANCLTTSLNVMEDAAYIVVTIGFSESAVFYQLKDKVVSDSSFDLFGPLTGITIHIPID